LLACACLACLLSVQRPSAVPFCLSAALPLSAAPLAMAMDPLARMRDKSKDNPRVFFDLTRDGRPLGRLVMELFADTTPLTAENFRCLCTGEKGVGAASRKPLHYKGTTFHRVIKGFMMQGGDFERGDGTGGESIYGRTFRDENFIRKHLGAGMLSLANAGPHTNGSQFFITFGSTPHLNGKHVVFGKVIEGLDIVKQVELSRTNAQDKPVQPIVIANCGQINDEAKAQAAKATAAGAAAKKAEPDSDDEAHELPAPRAAAAAAAGTSSGAAAEPAQPQFPVSKGTPTAAQTAVAAAAEEEKKLKAALAALPADMDPRQRKLAELKLKMSGARRANAAGVAEEVRKVQASQSAREAAAEGKKGPSANAEFRARRQAWESEQEAAGQDPALAYLHETAESAEGRAAGAKQKRAHAQASFGWDVFNQDAQYNAYEKRLAHVPQIASAGQSAAAAAAPGDALNALDYARSGKPSAEGVERMVRELEDTAKRREKFSRRRAFNEEEDVSYINERNRVFNKKANRAYEAYTVEIKQNIERGTAL